MKKLPIAAAAGVGALLLGLAGPASAHVTVTGPDLTVGQSDANITFRIPDESDTASTVGLKVRLPLDTPLAGVLVVPTPGWTARIIQTKLAKPIHTDDGDITEVVSEIDWTASSSGAIKPGDAGELSILVGKLPDGVSSLTFPAIQTYSDQTVVSWTDIAAPGSTTEPDHPAPTLALTADAAPPVAGSSSPSDSDHDGWGIGTGALGAVLGAAALVVAMRIRSRG